MGSDGYKYDHSGKFGGEGDTHHVSNVFSKETLKNILAEAENSHPREAGAAGPTGYANDRKQSHSGKSGSFKPPSRSNTSHDAAQRPGMLADKRSKSFNPNGIPRSNTSRNITPPSSSHKNHAGSDSDSDVEQYSRTHRNADGDEVQTWDADHEPRVRTHRPPTPPEAHGRPGKNNRHQSHHSGSDDDDVQAHFSGSDYDEAKLPPLRTHRPESPPPTTRRNSAKPSTSRKGSSASTRGLDRNTSYHRDGEDHVETWDGDEAPIIRTHRDIPSDEEPEQKPKSRPGLSKRNTERSSYSQRQHEA